MRRILLAGLVVSLLASFARAQKSMTILGDAWTGKVVATSDTTREIVIRAYDKDKTETFVGILEEGYKVKMKDGSQRELKVSEITPGMRIRVFYKTKQQDAGGQKTKVRSIYRVDFLGKDEYTKLREALNLEPSIPVIVANSRKLPTINPLKLYLSIEEPHIKDSLVEWVSEWNKEQAAKYGSLEIVPDPAQSDISLVVYWGADEMVAGLPLEFIDRSGRRRELLPATAHLTTKEGEGLEIIWQKLTWLSPEKIKKSESSVRSTVGIEKEMEKRLKSRAKK
ncbi:MAG TPA: hypothetical protein VF658_01675 [Pyrinomonadaceae bacterium]|jgi:hypothetical protein